MTGQAPIDKSEYSHGDGPAVSISTEIKYGRELEEMILLSWSIWLLFHNKFIEY